MTKTDPANARWLRDLAVSYYKLGDLHMSEKNWSEALESYHAGLPISERLAKADPDNGFWLRDLAASHDKIGGAEVAAGNPAEAMKSFQASFVIRDRMAKFEPGEMERLPVPWPLH